MKEEPDRDYVSIFWTSIHDLIFYHHFFIFLIHFPCSKYLIFYYPKFHSTDKHSNFFKQYFSHDTVL